MILISIRISELRSRSWRKLETCWKNSQKSWSFLATKSHKEKMYDSWKEANGNGERKSKSNCEL